VLAVNQRTTIDANRSLELLNLSDQRGKRKWAGGYSKA